MSGCFEYMVNFVSSVSCILTYALYIIIIFISCGSVEFSTRGSRRRKVEWVCCYDSLTFLPLTTSLSTPSPHFAGISSQPPYVCRLLLLGSVSMYCTFLSLLFYVFSYHNCVLYCTVFIFSLLYMVSLQLHDKPQQYHIFFISIRRLQSCR